MDEFKPDSSLVDRVQVSPNVNERKTGPTDILILHYTGMDNAEKSLKWLCMEQSQVSCHYFVFEDGTVVQSVSEGMRAWHAGLSHWRGETDINSKSIGIEIANRGHDHGYPEFPEAQVKAVIELSKDICRRNSIPAERVLAHSDIAPLRKSDPGEKFPWKRLHDEGIGHWVEEEPIEGGTFFQKGDNGEPIEALQSMLVLYGYGLEITGNYNEETEAVVRAFQRHFRSSKVDGIADLSTIKTLHKLSRALPVIKTA